MTVKITIEYATVDAAIVALGKLAGGAAAKAATAAPPVHEPLSSIDPPVNQRRGRSDKGKPRGHIVPTEPAAAPAPEGVTAVETTAPAPTVPPFLTPLPDASGEVFPKLAEAPAPTQEDAQKALESVFNGKGLQIAQETLSRFGCKRLKELKPEQYAEFIAACEKAVK